MRDIIRKVTDVITIVFPALIAVGGVLEATGVIQVLSTIEGVITAIVAGLSSAASIVFNIVTDVKTKGTD